MKAAQAFKLGFLLAPGAGAPSSSTWMQQFSRVLRKLGQVASFDYPYQLAGRRAPDKLMTLVLAHRAALARARAELGRDVVLVGKSMGGRVGCHLAVELGTEAPPALVCLGYPLVSPGGAVRDAVLLELAAPVLFVQGSRDPMCPLEKLDAVRRRMQAESRLHRVEGGDHSLVPGGAKAPGRTQEEVFRGVVGAIESFVSDVFG